MNSIIYLTGVSRPTLRATEDCPPELRPLAEWQYRGVFWSQYNGKDWTIAAFLQSDHGGLDLDVARDRATATSIRRTQGKLLDVPINDLRAKAIHGPLEHEDFDALIGDDPVDDLLIWLSDPKGTWERWETSQWDTLCSRCKSDYGFDPLNDGELVGAERLGLQAKPAWQTAWKRFAAMPSRCAGLVDLLRKAKPSSQPGDLLASLPSEAWPQDNEAEEAELRQVLDELATLPVAKARAQLRDLEQEHGVRRSWVWAKLGRTPLAQAIHPLNLMAEVTKTSLTGASAIDLIEVYTTQGWRADAAVVKTSAHVDLPCGAWFWSDAVRVTSPHGIDCFIAGKAYDHGGLSRQECVIPQLSIRARRETASSASIDSIRWVGLRCRVHIAGQSTGCVVDLRDKVNAPDTSLTGPRPIDQDGAVAFVVEDDAREGTAAILVLIDSGDTVVDKKAVTVGA